MTWLKVGGYASAGDRMGRVDFIFHGDNTRVERGRWPEEAVWLLVGTEFEDDWNYWFMLPLDRWIIDRVAPWWGRFAA